MNLIDREIMPAQARGINWGADRRVLARTGDCRTVLFIRGAHTMAVGARGFGREPVRSALVLLTPAYALGDTLKEGRVSQADIEALSGTIDKAFGPGTSAAINLSKTLVIG